MQEGRARAGQRAGTMGVRGHVPTGPHMPGHTHEGRAGVAHSEGVEGGVVVGQIIHSEKVALLLWSPQHLHRQHIVRPHAAQDGQRLPQAGARVDLRRRGGRAWWAAGRAEPEGQALEAERLSCPAPRALPPVPLPSLCAAHTPWAA